MVKVSVQKLPKKQIDEEDFLARFCFYFPQYTFAQARLLPFKRVQQMLTVALKEEARKMHDLTIIVAAPYSKKGQQVKKMLEYYKNIMEDKNG